MFTNIHLLIDENSKLFQLEHMLFLLVVNALWISIPFEKKY